MRDAKIYQVNVLYEAEFSYIAEDFFDPTGHHEKFY